MRASTVFLLVLCLTGCATLGRYDQSLNVKIEPFPIIQGRPFSAHINAPMEALEVVGHAEVPLGPEMKFKRNRAKRRWDFTGTVPKAFYIHPGTFKVRITVRVPDEKDPRYMEVKMVLKGE